MNVVTRTLLPSQTRGAHLLQGAGGSGAECGPQARPGGHLGDYHSVLRMVGEHTRKRMLMEVDPPDDGGQGITEGHPPPDNLRERVCAALGGSLSGPRDGADRFSNGTQELDLRSDPGGTPRGVDAEGDTFMSSAHGVDDGAIAEWFCPVGGCGHSHGDG